MNNFQQEYTNFLNKYQSGTVGPEEVGQIVAKWGQYFGEANLAYGDALKKFNIKNAELVQTIEDNGKPISSSKAQTLADASLEGLSLIDAKINKDIIEKQIGTLSTFQRSIGIEFSRSGNM